MSRATIRESPRELEAEGLVTVIPQRAPWWLPSRPRELLAVKDRFYDVLIDGADSPVLATLPSSLQARVSLLRATSLTHQGRPLEMLGELKTLAEAINARDADEAARLCAEHVRDAGRTGMAELAREEAAVLA